MLSDSILSLMLDDFFHAVTDTLSNFQEGRRQTGRKGKGTNTNRSQPEGTTVAETGSGKVQLQGIFLPRVLFITDQQYKTGSAFCGQEPNLFIKLCISDPIIEH